MLKLNTEPQRLMAAQRQRRLWERYQEMARIKPRHDDEEQWQRAALEQVNLRADPFE